MDQILEKYNEVCFPSYKNKKKMQVEKQYKGIAGQWNKLIHSICVLTSMNSINTCIDLLYEFVYSVVHEWIY